MSQKVWRNSEGREFPETTPSAALVGKRAIDYDEMVLLGYELMEVPEQEPEEFGVECTAGERPGELLTVRTPFLSHPRFIPGKTYMVREKR